MANGGWCDTPGEWQRLEGPLLTIDAVLQRFAATHPVTLSKNLKDWPERSLCWGDNPSYLIQLYLEEMTSLTWNIWLCCSEDRGDSRYWRTDFAVRGEPIEFFQERLPALLQEGFDTLEAWGGDPDYLQFVTKLAPMPPP